MTTSLGNSNANTWKQVKLQYLTLVAGIALATGGALALGGWQGGDTAHVPLVSRAEQGRSSISRPAPAEQEVYYLINSQAQADLVAHIEAGVSSEQRSSNDPQPDRRVYVLTATTAANEAAALYLISEESRHAHGVAFSFVDLRSR